MALYDSADLLTRLRRMLNVPTTDEWAETDTLYQYLTDAQTYWQRQLSVHVPELVSAAPVQLETSDNLTFSLPSGAGIPLGRFEVFCGRGLDMQLRRGHSSDLTADFYDVSPTSIRMVGETGSAWSGGLWTRIVPMTGTLDAANEPTIMYEARELLVPRAAAMMATRGGERDPAPYLSVEQRLAWGDPMTPADTGIIPALKSRVHTFGGPSGGGMWWRGQGYGQVWS